MDAMFLAVIKPKVGDACFLLLSLDRHSTAVSCLAFLDVSVRLR
jgi:hypothetical protein